MVVEFVENEVKFVKSLYLCFSFKDVDSGGKKLRVVIFL